MPFLFDRIRETTTTTGTGTITLAGAVTGYRTFSSVLSTNDTCYYVIEDAAAGVWECGVGTLASSTTLARTTVTANSSGTFVAINFGAGTKSVWIDTTANYFSRVSLYTPPGGRLTLTSGTPITTSDVTGATTVYYTPFVGNGIVLWNGVNWVYTEFTETSLSLGTVTTGIPYDVFGSLSGGALQLNSLAWKNATVTISIASPAVVTWNSHGMSNNDPVVFTSTSTMPTGLSANTTYYAASVATNTFQVSATPGGSSINTTGSGIGTLTGWQASHRGTDVTLQDGRYCKSGDKTSLLLGTIFTTSTTATESSLANRYLSNVYNQIPLRLHTCPGYSDNNANTSYTIATQTFTEANGGTNSRVSWVSAIPGQRVFMGLSAMISPASTAAAAGLGYDSAMDVRAIAQLNGAGIANQSCSTGDTGGTPGKHFYTLSINSNAGTSTFFADGARSAYGAPADVKQTFLEGWVMG